MKQTLLMATGFLLLGTLGAAVAAPTVEVSGKIELHDLNMASDDALEGLDMVMETAGALFNYREKHNAWPQGLTDAFASDAPTLNMIIWGKDEVSVRWELGPVPAEGRELKMIRVFWSMEDGLRNRVNVKFAVRDVATGEWRDVCAYVKVVGNDRWAEDNTYRSLTLRFPAGEVRNFDAIRMYEGAAVASIYPPRWVEVDAFVGPPAP
ncbi:MAG: hypothetical protein GX100_07765 [candidate division WS1 bacterium]|jgi:hypothetical protein|nr:hypothetical protein [candidate division WS1 bacterium]